MTEEEVDRPPTLQEIERRVSAEALRRDPESDAMVEAALNLFSEAIGQLASLKATTERDCVAYWMVAGELYSLVGAYRLLPLGYYRQAASLIRTALEDFLSCSYIWKHPEKTKLWLQPKWNLIPKFRKMHGDLGPELSDWWQGRYDMLCEFAHPRGRALAQIAAQVRRGALEPYFDGKHFFALSHVIVETVLCTLAVVPFLNGTVSQSDSLTREFSRLQERFQTWSKRPA